MHDGQLCECGHTRRNHRDGGQLVRCSHYGCNCPHFHARRVCRRCGSLGIAYRFPVRQAQLLKRGVTLIRYARDGPDNRLVRDEEGKLKVATRGSVRVSLELPGIYAVRRLQSRLADGMEPRGGQDVVLALFLDPGQWLCPWCHGTGVRNALTRAGGVHA